MKHNVLKQLKKLRVSKEANILLALSGGVDSMVLMHLLYTLGFQFSVAHCNFCLRGSESDSDAAYIKKVVGEKKIQLFSKRFNTLQYAESKTISIQMAARELRYDWFRLLQDKYKFRFIATAHHYDDSVETLLVNLIRGTGIAGLHGIQPIDTDIIRPLLPFYKSDLIQYAQENKIKYCEDSSNSDDKYVRNKIRNKIIPIMQEINPSVIDAIGKTISRINIVESIYKQVVSQRKLELLEKSGDEYRIGIRALLKEIYPKQLLYEMISDFGFYDVDSVFKSLESESGKEFFNADYYMVKDRMELIISKHIVKDHVVINDDTKSIVHPFNIDFQISAYKNLNIKNASNKIMYIDYSRLEFPLLIRSWKEGDRFVPLGMKGFKKVSDYFIDNKFSLIKKKQTRFLISNHDIVCIIGERLDDRFKLVENSKKVYIVNL